MARPSDTGALGATAVALPLADGCVVPAGCHVVVADPSGRTRRLAAAGGRRLGLAGGERAWAFHPGPYAVDVAPFAAAPEIGLATRFVIDTGGPEDGRRRFDLFLASETAGRLDLAPLGAMVEDALRRELAGGGLDLPPCTTIEEWNAFRLGFNRLLYLRFGLTVDDCVPVDLGERVDHAALLAQRAAARAAAVPATDARREPVAGAREPAPATVSLAADDCPAAEAVDDARALRRLFLELPCLMCALRLAALPGDAALFRRQQGLLARLDLLAVGVTTMPALALAAPGRPLPAAVRRLRAAHAVRAARALDDAWALLARLEGAPQAGLAALYDECERIVANLEHECGARRATHAAMDVTTDATFDAHGDRP